MFYRGMRTYLNDPLLKYGTARTADLQRNLEQESGKNLTSFFQKWCLGEGFPSYQASWSQDAGNRFHIKIGQTSSHPSVAFFDMPVPIYIRGVGRDTVIVFDHLENNQSFLSTLDFAVDTVIIDPDRWILAGSKSAVKTGCAALVVGNHLLPVYEVEWTQSANGWVHLHVVQTNMGASPVAENIPFRILIKGVSKDTTIEIKNLRYAVRTWFSPGFEVKEVTGSGASCLMPLTYKIVAISAPDLVNDVTVFPTPVVGDRFYVSLRAPTEKTAVLRLYNVHGQLLRSSTVDTPGRDELIPFNVSGLPRGVYILNVRGGKSLRYTRKIVI